MKLQTYQHLFLQPGHKYVRQLPYHRHDLKLLLQVYLLLQVVNQVRLLKV